ncbi:zinc finger protein 532 isoform X1 [Ambystoma mexicanum]|uniref:zinc finger protein 532 isoform X1 n=1 Tax=Ambystoma mexicanum TaxID=8296 RepID=UPI0037E85209
MGDMKTPDFDDLLAAFDIPDMVDPKAAIESGHDDHENHIKTHPHTDEDSHVPSSSDVGVSVIVKNIRIDTEGVEKDVHHMTSNGLHNGFLTVSNLERFNREGILTMKDLGTASEGTLKNSVFNQFSPISSAEEFEDDEKIEVVDPPDKDDMRSGYRASMLTRSFTQQEYDRLKALGRETLNKSGFSYSMHNSTVNGPETNCVDVSICEPFKVGQLEDNLFNDSVKPLEKMTLKETSAEKSETDSTCGTQFNCKAKPSLKLSSCIAAIQALNARKVSPDRRKNSQSNSAGSSPLPKERIESPVPIEQSSESVSLIDGANKLLVKQPDSPRSVSSETSSKGSPSSPAGSTPAIPKVRIKTIKTSSGEIKRTVTRVLPEFDLDCEKRTPEHTPSMISTSFFSPPSSPTVLSSPPKASLQSTPLTTTVTTTDLFPKPVTMKPVATAFLPVSAVKTAGSHVINLKLANNTTVKATVISAASVQSASGSIIKAANAIQQQAVVVPAASIASAKLVPKTVHLANLNILPHRMQGTSELRQVLTKPHQQMKQTLVSVATQHPKKFSRVQMVASSSQSSVVEAFNKVLSSVNPVPIYTPNLCPPAHLGIILPARGYKCLECGDSFVLEKSLMQHYDRRSVRIEVTCNHCTKNLVFYNKCSLLSHARGHKEKGVVMQCSHLILKPVPVDQMIASTFITLSTAPSNASALLHGPLGISSPATLKLPSSTAGTVISAPMNAPVVPAMPLEEDPSKLCRHNLKCLECNDVFQDETTLATHFQHSSDTSGQKTCSICQMLLPNPCSFSSHQRIHQHKSPYTCPECGAICRSAHFQTHVTKNCLHYTRRIGFRCLHCNVIYSEVASLKAHIQGAHCEVFYKCPICPMAFKSAPSTHSHVYTQHPGVKIGEPKTIYKCSMCETVFTLQTLLYRHFDQHIENQKVSVFKCPDCALLYAQKQLMMDHIKTMHGTLKSVEGPPNLGINLPISTKPSLQNSTSHTKDDAKPAHGIEHLEKKPMPVIKSAVVRKGNTGWTCWDCDELFLHRDAYITHMKKDHGKQMKKHPCRQCEKSFSSSHSLCRHNRIKHKGIRKVYNRLPRPAVNGSFMKQSILEKQIEVTEDVKEPEFEEVAELTEASENTTLDESVEKEDTQGSTPKRKLEEPVEEFSPTKGAVSQPLKKLKINVFKVHKCAVCGFTTENLLQFHEHIPQHKSNGSSYQCRECGLCYTSHVSLSRHLFIIHKLKEPQPVSKQNGSGEENHHESKSGPEDELSDFMETDKRCKVCGKTFETETALNTHMRTHGMAFIKSKRMNCVEK